MSSTADQQAAKAWRLRNSDGKHSLGDEHMTPESRRIQPPPAFTLTETPIPSIFSTPDDAEEARAIRHTHVWSVEEPE